MEIKIKIGMIYWYPSVSDDYDKLLEKYKLIWITMEDLKTIEMNALLVLDDRYIKPKWEHTVIKFILIFTV